MRSLPTIKELDDAADLLLESCEIRIQDGKIYAGRYP
jgi:hypothetical protein